jgi:ankyrin repeat protein
MSQMTRLATAGWLLGVALVMSSWTTDLYGAETELVQAARKGDLEKVQQLLSRGGTHDSMALWIAAGLGHVEIVRLFLDAGAPIEFRLQDAGGYTPLLVATSEGKLEVMQLLLDRGADPNVRDDKGNPALATAATVGKGQKIEAMRILLDHGADVNAQQSVAGATSLHRAAWDGDYEMARLLLERGASTSIRVTMGSQETPAEGARKNGHMAVAQLIEQAAIRPLTSPRRSQPATIPQMAAKPTPTAPNSDVDQPSMTRTAKQNRYAIVVGVEQYRAKLPKADFAAQDAKIMGAYLTKTMGFSEENVAILINENATRTDLEKYLEHWLPNRVEKDSTVFIYYSGHGAPNPKTGDAYLVPYDGDPAFVEATGYPLKRLYAQLGKLPAKEVVVLLDSCFSGAGGRSVIAKGMRPMVLSMENPVLAGGKTVVLAASKGDQVSSTYDPKGHGLLTYFFLKGLQGEADMNKDGSVDLAEVYEYLKPQVERTARRDYNNDQTPQLLSSPGLPAKGIRLIERPGSSKP